MCRYGQASSVGWKEVFRWLAGVQREGGEYPFLVGFLPSTLRAGLRETTEGPTACGRAEVS